MATIFLSDEFRLAYALLLQAAALAGAWRFVRRRLGTDWADRAADALLLSLLVQYAAVTLPGLAGILSPVTIALTTVALSALLFLLPARTGWVASATLSSPELPLDRWTLLACALFAAAYAAALGYQQRFMPVMANDAITYHFPAAVHWLQTGRLSVFETWFFNPANAYSPLAGSTFVAWWVAPVGNDVLARHVQVPALLLTFFAALRLTRALGVRTAVAALLALALVLSRPCLRQSITEKDDLYLTAFFACAAAACAPQRLRDAPLGPWRLGVALGLMLATKFTALLALPALLLLVDAPFRAGWRMRHFATALACVLLIAGPWYLRNWLLTGNPLFPVAVKLGGVTLFDGPLTTARSDQLATARSIFSLLTTRDQSLPALPLIALLVATVAALARRFRQVKSDPLTRLGLLGPFVLFLVFVTASPYPEVRFLYPAFVLLYAAAGVAITAWLRPVGLQLFAAGVILVLSWATALMLNSIVAELLTAAATVAVAGLCVVWVVSQFTAARRDVAAGGAVVVGVLSLAALIYVEWPAYLQSCRELAVDPAYRAQYGEIADVWKFVRDELPPTEPLAYANTFLIHPMSGFDHARPLVYVPTRRSVLHLHDLPPLPGKLAGETLVPAVAAALTADPDPPAWLARLAQSPATHLVVFKKAVVTDPPELAIIRDHPGGFERVFDSPAASVYRLRR